MAIILTTGTTGADTLNVIYNDLASDTHVIDGLAGDDVITLTGELPFAAGTGNSIEGGADFDTLVLSGQGDKDLRNWSLSGLEKIVNSTDNRVYLSATQLLGLGANIQFEATGGSGYLLNIVGDDGQDVSLANLTYVNWEPNPGNGYFWTTIVGGNGDETYVAGAERVIINGNAGDDVIYGSPELDMLHGGDGDDIIHSNGSLIGDSIYGDAGNDELWGEGPSAVVMDGGIGSDTYHVFVGGITQQIHMHETGTDIDTVISHIVGSYSLRGVRFENISVADGILGSVYGNRGHNVVTGNNLSNTLSGQGGNDTLFGEGGSDTIIGGIGDDTAQGGGGSDDMSGNDGTDTFRGNAGDDLISGGDGDDVLRGDAGSDEINGGQGGDLMYAGALDGFVDNFVFSKITDSGTTGILRDRIYEFELGVDKIDLKAIDASSANGNGTFSFIGSGAFTAEGQIRVTASGANTLLEINSTGTSGADSSVLIIGISPAGILATDFIL